MFRSIFTKTIYEKRWMIIGWMIGMFAMTMLTMVFYPYFKNSGFEEMIQSAPKSLQSLLGDAANYKTVAGYVGQQIFALRLPLMAIIMAIIVFTGLGVGDENRGTLETLLAEPVSRAEVFFKKYFAGMLVIGVASIGIIGGVVASYPFIHGSMNFGRLVLATIACWLIAMVFGTLTYALGAVTGNRGVTIAVSSAVAFLSYLISSMAPAVDKLKSAQKGSVFYYYNTPSIADKAVSWSHLFILVCIILVLLLGSMAVFRRRDLVRD